MSYVRSWERMGIEKGKEEGHVEEKRAVLVRQLDKKFGLTEGERELIEKTDHAAKLDASIDAILFAETKDEVLKVLSI